MLILNTSPPNVETLGAPEIVGICVGAVIAAILIGSVILFICVIVKKFKPPKSSTQLTGMSDGETEGLLSGRNTPPKYGNSDGTVTLPRLTCSSVLVNSCVSLCFRIYW